MSMGMIASKPEQYSGRSHWFTAARTRVVFGWKTFSGIMESVPLHVSVMSHTLKADRTMVLEGLKVSGGQPPSLFEPQVSETSQKDTDGRQMKPTSFSLHPHLAEVDGQVGLTPSQYSLSSQSALRGGEKQRVCFFFILFSLERVGCNGSHISISSQRPVDGRATVGSGA